MTWVITSLCRDKVDMSCVEVCPVDCIHTTEEAEQYFIEPETCIDCGYCVAACPVTAIYDEFNIPSEWRHYMQKNRQFYR